MYFFFVKYEINFQFSYNNDTTTAVKIYFSKNRMRALINSIIHNMQFSFDGLAEQASKIQKLQKGLPSSSTDVVKRYISFEDNSNALSSRGEN